MAKIVIKIKDPRDVRKVLDQVSKICQHWVTHLVIRGDKVVETKLILDEDQIYSVISESSVKPTRVAKVCDLLKEKGLDIRQVYEKVKQLGLEVELVE